MPEPMLLITCEHAVNHVPQNWQGLFTGRREVLDTHRAWDPGAMELARRLAGHFAAPCYAARVTRLLVDHNRSPHHRALWSEFSRPLSEQARESMLEDYYRPFRRKVAGWLEDRCGEQVVHLSVHSFTPVLDGRVRNLDIGLLYDPRRPAETALGRAWKTGLARTLPDMRVRCNQPYRGRSDGHQTTYRKRYPDDTYRALEVEVNQALLDDPLAWSRVCTAIVASLAEVLENL